MAIRIQWVKTSHESMSESGPVAGPECIAWYNSAKLWWRAYLKSIGATNFKFRRNHYTFSIEFCRNGQWWWGDSGDVRGNYLDSFLLRKVNGPGEFKGANMEVKYTDRFQQDLEDILFRDDGVLTRLTSGVDIIRPGW